MSAHRPIVVRHSGVRKLKLSLIYGYIKIGDTVQTMNKPTKLFGVLKVISIEGANALCSHYLLDKNSQGDERPSELIPSESLFPLKDLTLIKEGTTQ